MPWCDIRARRTWPWASRSKRSHSPKDPSSRCTRKASRPAGANTVASCKGSAEGRLSISSRSPQGSSQVSLVQGDSS